MANIFKDANFGDIFVRRDGKKCVFIAQDGRGLYKYRMRELVEHERFQQEIVKYGGKEYPNNISITDYLYPSHIGEFKYEIGDWYVRFNGHATQCSKWKSNSDVMKIDENKLQNVLNLGVELNDIQARRTELNERYDTISKQIAKAISDTEVRNKICKELVKAIDKFDLNNGRSDEYYITSTVNYSSTGWDATECAFRRENPQSKFRPYDDNWELVGVETKEVNCIPLYKITVDNKKGREYLWATSYRPDLFSTDWFSL